MDFSSLANMQEKCVKECSDFIVFIENNFVDHNNLDTNSSTLKNLLYKKLRLFSSINFKNQSSKKIKALDEQIYRQIVILKKEIRQNFKNEKNLENYNFKNIINYAKDTKQDILTSTLNTLLNNKFFEKHIYEKAQKVKKEAFFDIVKFIKNNKWISTILFFGFGLIVYLMYFNGNVPYAFGQDFAYGIIVSSAVFFLIPTVVLVFLLGVWWLYDDDKRKDKFENGFLKSLSSISIHLLAFIMFLVFVAIFKDQLNKIMINPLIFLLLLLFLYALFLYIVYFAINSKNMSFSLFIFTMFFILYLSFILSARSGNINLIPAFFFVFIALLLFWISLCDTYTYKNFYTVTFSIFFILFLFSFSAIISEKAYQALNFGNINYKYITLDIKAKNSIPKSITQQDDINKADSKNLTYIENFEDSIKIYNVKAISALGDHWNLETDDGTQFEISSKFIEGKSRENKF